MDFNEDHDKKDNCKSDKVNKDMLTKEIENFLNLIGDESDCLAKSTELFWNEGNSPN